MLFNFGKGVATHDGFGRWSTSEDIIKKQIFYRIKTQDFAVKFYYKKLNRLTHWF